MKLGLLLAAMLQANPNLQNICHIRIVDNPQFTKEVMVKRSGIAGKQLKCISRNPQGDCLCVGKFSNGSEFMVDVDHRDVVK